jgi:hypothetical protein
MAPTTATTLDTVYVMLLPAGSERCTTSTATSFGSDTSEWVGDGGADEGADVSGLEDILSGTGEVGTPGGGMMCGEMVSSGGSGRFVGGRSAEKRSVLRSKTMMASFRIATVAIDGC